MATRFYLPSSGAPGITPAFGGGWASTVNADRIEMVTTRISSSMVLKEGNPDAGFDQAQLLRQFISEQALAAQTITGTIKGQARLAQNSGAAAFSLAIRIAVCSGDGSSVTEIMAIQRSNSTSVSPPGAAGATPTNRRFEQGVDDFSLDLTETAISSGSFLIAEIGYWDVTGNTGRQGQIVFGDDSATDLPEDESTTTADNPWIEFSMDISFGGGGGATKLPRLSIHSSPLSHQMGRYY